MSLRHRLLGSICAAILAVGLVAPAEGASLTPPNLTAATTINSGDLLLVWPAATGGPLEQIQWSVLSANMVSTLGSSFLRVSNNLSDVANAGTARSNLGLGSAATVNTGGSGSVIPLLSGTNTWSGEQTFGPVTGLAPINLAPSSAPASPVNGDCWITTVAHFCRINGVTQQFLEAANNLSDLTSAAAARTSLGVSATGADTAYALRSNNLSDLGSAATARTNLGITATGADTTYVFRSNNLSDIANAATARTNLGVTATGADATYASRANNLSDLTSATSARSNLGLGTSATVNTGTSGATVPLLNGTNTWSGKQTLFAATSATASFNIPEGIAPSAPVNGDIWTTTGGVFAEIGGSAIALATTSGSVTSFNLRTGAVVLSAGDVNTVLAGDTLTGSLTTLASTTGGAGLNLAPGVAPTAPNNGDLWGTSGGVFARVNGVTQQFMAGGNNLSDLASASTARTNLGLGTAATVNTGTSGAVIPLLNGANAFSGAETHSAEVTLAASTTASAGLNVPQGSAPTSPNNGDAWTTSGGLFVRTGGVTNTVAFTSSSITGNAATATVLQTPRTITLTSDISCTTAAFDGSGNVSGGCTLPTVNSNVGTFTNATVTVNAKGQVTAASSGSATTVAQFSNQQASGTGSGETLTATAWTPRTFNTTNVNNISGLTLSSNLLSIPAGTYEFYITAPANLNSTVSLKSRLHNDTDGTSPLVSSMVVGTGTSSVVNTIIGTVTIAATKTFEVDSYTSVSGATGGGSMSSGEPEIYTTIYIRKVA